MIETSEQVYQAIEQMGRMQRILESYRNEILAKNPRNFALLAEGPLEQLRQSNKFSNLRKSPERYTNCCSFVLLDITDEKYMNPCIRDEYTERL